MKNSVRLIAVISSFAALAGFAQTGGQTKPTQAAVAPSATHAPVDRGERAYNANCSRCHYAPETLNPRITGTIVRHMRVRANLSAADERAILHYLNP